MRAREAFPSETCSVAQYARQADKKVQMPAIRLHAMSRGRRASPCRRAATCARRYLLPLQQRWTRMTRQAGCRMIIRRAPTQQRWPAKRKPCAPLKMRSTLQQRLLGQIVPVLPNPLKIGLARLFPRKQRRKQRSRRCACSHDVPGSRHTARRQRQPRLPGRLPQRQAVQRRLPQWPLVHWHPLLE